MRVPSYTKKKTKKWHDSRIISRQFEAGQQVLLFNSRLKLFPGKLKSRWSGPFVVVQAYPHGVVEIAATNSRRTFKVNDQRLKYYWGDELNR